MSDPSITTPLQKLAVAIQINAADIVKPKTLTIVIHPRFVKAFARMATHVHDGGKRKVTQNQRRKRFVAWQRQLGVRA